MPIRLPSRLRVVRRRWWAVSLVLLVALGGGAWTWLSRDTASATQRITATVARGTYKTTVSATGTITPRRRADLTFSSPGTVTRVAVAVGDKVRKGDVLARIDATSLEAQRSAAQAQVTAAQSQLSQDSGGTSTQIASDEAALAAAESDLAAAEDAVTAATITAPFSGTVSAVGFAVGDQVGSSAPSSGSGSGSGAPSITLISPRSLEIDADVSAADVGQLRKGMQVEITPTGGGAVVYGTVEEIAVIATASDTGAAQFPVTIAVTGKPTGLYAGSTATALITVKQANNVLAVDTPALHTDSSGTYVYVIKGSKRIRTPVTVGTAYGMQTEVLSGLNEGDVVEVASFTRPSGSGNTRNGNGGNGVFELPGGAVSGGAFPGGGQGPVLQGSK